jgi:hypothetical protein
MPNEGKDLYVRPLPSPSEKNIYFTLSLIPSEWDENSGAYML